MAYVDAFAAPVPLANREQYIDHSTGIAAIFEEYGAIGYVECRGDELPDGEITSSPLAVEKTVDETVCIGWAVWPSRDFRNRAMEKLMQDERMEPENMQMPFDGMRLIFGGFEVIVDA